MKQECIELLDKNFIEVNKINQTTACYIKKVKARELLVPQRLDLMAKWIYIDAYIKNESMDFAREIYEKHIQAFSLNSFCEPGNDEKNSLDKYYETFNTLIDDIKVNGVDSSKSLVPVGKNNIILDGAHRTSIAAYFDQYITIAYFPDLEVNFNYEFFLQRKMSTELIDYLVLKFISLQKDNIYFACFWPVADNQSKLNEAIKLISNIVYKKEIILSKEGLQNYMLQIFDTQSWVGTIENHFEELNGKVNECYKPCSQLKIVIFKEKGLKEVLELKDKIINVLKIEKHSIHISNTIEESKLMSELLLNQNSLHLLNFGIPEAGQEYFLDFKRKKVNLDPKVILSIYGLEGIQANLDLSNFSMINPRNYAQFFSCKLISLPYIKENGDKKLVTIASRLLKKDSNYISKDKRRILYFKTYMDWYVENNILKVKICIAKILNKIGLYKK